MLTIYDFITVGCFACVVLTYFFFTDGGLPLLAHFMVSVAAFAVANQIGNAGMNYLAIILIAAGIGYTFINARGALKT